MRVALIASLATGASLGIMGVYLAIRRVAFMGLVLANAATVGAAVAFYFDLSAGPVSVALLSIGVLAAAAVGHVSGSH